MKKMVLTAIAVFAAAALMAQEQQDRLPVYENVIQVNGKSEREVAPDEIYLTIVINQEQLRSRQTMEQAERDMIAALKRGGIDTDQNLRIGNMSSQYKEYFLRRNANKSIAYYELKVNSAAQLGQVFQILEPLGVSDISITRLDHSRMDELQNEVRMEAMRDARRTAQALAEAVGQQAGRAVYIMDYNQTPRYAMAYAEDAVMLRSAATTDEYYMTELEFRPIKISYNVTAKFELK